MKNPIQLSDYKFFVFDIDGTLVGSSHELHPFTKEVLLSLHDLDLPFTLATGKILPATKAQADELRIDLPLIMATQCCRKEPAGARQFCLPVDVTAGDPDL